MTPTGPPDESPHDVARLPVRDVSEVDAQPPRRLATVTRLAGPTRTPTAPGPAAAPDPGRAPASDTEDDAVLALLQARLGYRAATAAAKRVRLPSLSDFLA